MSSEISDEKAVISIEVNLVSEVTGDPTTGITPTPFLPDLPEDLSEIIAEEVNSTMKDLIDDILAEEGVDVDSLKEITSLVKDVDSKGVGNLKQMASNTQNFMENTIMSTLARAGPQGALVAAIISAIAGTPAMVDAVVEALGVKGAPLNQDFRYSQEEQYNQQFDRHVQFRRLTGDDPVITVTTKGFVAGDPDFVGNSLVDLPTGRTARINLRQSSLEYIHGI